MNDEGKSPTVINLVDPEEVPKEEPGDEKIKQEVEEKPKTMEESWYVKDEFVYRTVLGVKTKIRVLKGSEFMQVSRQCQRGKDINRVKYSKIMIKKCIVDPKPDYEKISAAAITMLIVILEDVHGLSEVVGKNPDIFPEAEEESEL